MRENNFYYLLAGLLVLLVIQPIVRMAVDRSTFPLLEIAFVLTIVVGVWSLQESRRSFYAGLFFAALGAVLAVASGSLSVRWLLLVQLANLWLFCLVSVVITMRHVLGRGAITLNHLAGSACAYLLLGTLWAIAYLALQTMIPGAFAITADAGMGEFIYFSFVTLTTLGYGEITPAIPVARTLAYLEAVAGQLYIAVLVAGLVGRHVAEGQPPQEVANR